MLRFKFVGMIMIAIGGLALALLLNKRSEQVLKEAVSWVELLKHISEQISVFAMPITEIIMKTDRKILYDCGIEEDIDVGRTFKEIVISRRELDKETGKIVRAFAENFGKNDRGEQVKECEYYIRLMEARRTALSEQLPKKKKINITLCISSALAIIIMLI